MKWCRREIGAFFNNLSSLKYVRSDHAAKLIYAYLLNISFFLIFFSSSIFNDMKRHINFISKFAMPHKIYYSFIHFYLGYYRYLFSHYLSDLFKYSRRAKLWT